MDDVEKAKELGFRLYCQKILVTNKYCALNVDLKNRPKTEGSIFRLTVKEANQSFLRTCSVGPRPHTRELALAQGAWMFCWPFLTTHKADNEIAFSYYFLL